MAQLGYGDLVATPGAKWEFPVLEFFTKLESTDRPLTLSEALAISGLSAEQLEEILFKTAWVAGWVKFVCARSGLELADGKLEWAVNEAGEIILVDAIGPDELRILSGEGVQLSKEFLRAHYRGTPWYEAVVKAKQEASRRGSAEWKKWVTAGPEPLPQSTKELASQLYRALANELTSRSCFPDAWPLKKVTLLIGELHAASGLR
jgi:phosphoribosylaminoimidazole-succinocarboxamide synthase